MRHRWLRRAGNNSETLLVFALGWGQDGAALDAWGADVPEDVLLLFAWDDPAALPDVTAYRYKYLTAWSFGVWSAARLAVQWERATAINGTLTPVDDAYGIPAAHFEATLANWNGEGSVRKFWRRMGALPGDWPLRAPEELKQELVYFQKQFAVCPAAENCYQRAVIGRNDRIFPPEQQHAAWMRTETAVAEVDWPHDFRSACHTWSEVARVGND